MRKEKLFLFGALLALASFMQIQKSRAGTPQDRDIANGAYSDTSVFGSTITSSANLIYTLAAPSTKNSGGGSFSGRYCFNNILTQLTAGATGYVIDNATTPTNSNAYAFLGAATTVPIKYDSPHLEPLCFGFGDTANFVILGTAGPGSFSYQGFITYGKSGGSILNGGQ
jgi:hypothetical protein